MDYLLIGFGGGLIVAGVAWAVWRLARRGRDKDLRNATTVTYETFITSMKGVPRDHEALPPDTKWTINNA